MNLKGGRPERFGAIASFFYRLCAERALSPMHDRIAAEIPVDRGRILDVGCGPGRLTRRIAAARPNAEVTGLDLSADMIRQAERAPKLRNLVFRQGRPASLEGGAPFDFAVSVLSFHHWEEPAEDLSAIHRILSSSGRLWIYEQDPEADGAAIHADRARLWLGLRMPLVWQRHLARGHGFTAREIEANVRPLVERTWKRFEISRSGSCLRMELQK